MSDSAVRTSSADEHTVIAVVNQEPAFLNVVKAEDLIPSTERRPGDDQRL